MKKKGHYIHVWISESRFPEFQAFKNACEAKGKFFLDATKSGLKSYFGLMQKSFGKEKPRE